MKHITWFVVMSLSLISCSGLSNRKKADSLKDSAVEAMEAAKYSLAITTAKEALEMYRNMADTNGVIESNYLMARASALSGDFENAVLYGENGSDLCKDFENYPMEYKLNNTLSWAYFTMGKSFDETLEHQERQIFVVGQLDDDHAKAMVYNNYGYDVTVSGTVALTDAIEYMQFANDYYARTENNHGRWYTLMNLAWQHRLMNDLAKSEKYGQWAVKQAGTDNDRHAIIEANTNLGETLLAQDRVEDARPLYEYGLKLSKQADDRDRYVFDVYYSRYLWETGRTDEAISSLKNAVDFLENSEIFYEMLARALLADYYFATGNTEGAEEQVKIFKNPRAGYISQESKAIAGAVEAQLVSMTDREKAVGILENMLEDLNKSGAEILRLPLLKLREEL